MAETMSPSEVATITLGQIAKFGELQAAALRKSGLLSAEVQPILEGQGGAIADEFVASVRRRVEASRNMIVRRVRVDRTKEPQQMLDATGRAQYANPAVVKEMPRGESGEVEVVFFKLDLTAANGYISDDDLAKEFKLRGIVDDPYAVAQVNTDDSAFADTRPNGCHWKNKDGRWCYMTFGRWSDGARHVNVSRRAHDWPDRWWFAGSRASS